MKALLNELGNLAATYGMSNLEAACKTFFKREKVSVRGLRISRSCKHCGKTFELHPCRVRSGRGMFCSRKCADTAKHNRIEKQCQQCGNMFMAMPSQFKHYKGANQYCSRACAYAGNVAKTVAKPIKDKYGRSNRKADKEWMLAVRERDNYTCQRCGKYDRYIHTHHVAPRSRRPDLRHDVTNGKCLCGSCHLWCHHHPVEATALGLLSDASYERAKKERTFCRLCGNPNAGLGLCTKHYKRFRKYGDPLLTKRQGHSEDVPFLSD